MQLAKMVFLTTLCLRSLTAFAGFGAHGGDLCEVEIKGMIPLAGSWLESNRGILKLSVGYKEFVDAFADIVIRCVDTPLILDGAPKTFINDRDKKTLTANVERWSKGSLIAKQASLVHEGLVLLEIEKTDNYRISNRLFSGTNLPFERFFCVKHFNGEEEGITDTVFEISPSPPEIIETEYQSIFAKTTIYQARILRGEFDHVKQEMHVIKQLYPLSAHLSCNNTTIDPRLVTCNDTSGPYRGRTFDTVRTSLLVSRGKPRFLLELQMPLLGTPPYQVDRWGYQKFELEKIWGDAKYKASAQYDYAPWIKGFQWSYCGIK